jgi:hypothetical protein
MATTKKPAAAKHDPKSLPVPVGPDQDMHKALAEVATAGIAGNAYMVQKFGAGTFGELSLGECIGALKGTARAVHGGDLAHAETLLTVQASALNAMFCELARRSALNMGEYINAAETYMRLALKAQAQCRATLETLAAIKNPPQVFAKQANINNGGQQQVINGAQPAAAKAHGGPESLAAPEPRTDLVPTQGVFSAPNEIQTAGFPR